MVTIPAPAWTRPAIARHLVVTLACAAWLSAYVLGGFAFEGSSEDRRALFWAAAMVMSFAGWGRVVSLLLDREAEVDWGLRAAWGMAAVALLGGFLVAAGIGSGPVLRLVVGVGIGVLVASALRPRPGAWKPRTDAAFWGVVCIVLPLVVLTCVGSMTDRGQLWAFDDTPAYLVFPEQLFQAGDMLQPFSFRRMSSFGAQSFFQAILLVGAVADQIHLFDRGVCTTVVVAMILGAPQGRSSSPFVLRLLPALIVLFLPNYRINAAAVLSGTVFFFAIYRTLELPASTTRRPRMHALVLGLLVAAACALRPFFVLPATLTVALGYAIQRDRGARGRVMLDQALVAGGVTLLALLPWSLALLRSNGTPLYPPFAGDYRVESGFTKLMLGFPRLKMIWDELRALEPIASIDLFFVAGLITLKKDTPAFRATYLALLIGFVAMVGLTPVTDSRELLRYVYPLELAFALAVAMRSLAVFSASGESGGAEQAPFEPAAMAVGFLVLIACAGELYWKHDEVQRSYDDMFDQTVNVLEGRALLPGGGHPPMFRLEDGVALETPMISLNSKQTYVDLQRAIPAGAPMLAMVEEPYRFDFRRNPIDVLDLPGVAGPAGGIPMFRGPDAVARYFLSLGFRYITLVDTSSCLELYSQRAWETYEEKRVGPQSSIAPGVLDIFNNFARLTRSRPHLFEESGMVVLDLGRR